MTAYLIKQLEQLRNPDSRIVIKPISSGSLLDTYAFTAGGVCSFDTQRFFLKFWEVVHHEPMWLKSQTTVKVTQTYGGCNNILRWEEGKGGLFKLVEELKKQGYTSGIWKAGIQIWGKQGVLVSLIGNLPCTLYLGGPFDNNTGVIVPKDSSHLPAIWKFCESTKFHRAIREIDQSLKVTNANLVKVPFDLGHWQRVAEEIGPIPPPHSEDPTQWLFKGNIRGSEQPLHVAVGRLIGYKWPEQPEDDALSRFADQDGIVCLPAVHGERPAVDRLRELLAAAYGEEWSVAKEDELLEQVGYRGKGLDTWLRDAFFDQHSKLFHNRPFIWHIWDKNKDGFSALVNYHTLDRAKLEKLIYYYLGDWISRQKSDMDADKPGAENRFFSAMWLKKSLELILVGEKPYDIYVRWKSAAEQPLGWEPDLNDGVRLNIRPFVHAEVLRSKITINWNKDRGHNPDGSERINDIHLSLEEKRKAREERIQ